MIVADDGSTSRYWWVLNDCTRSKRGKKGSIQVIDICLLSLKHVFLLFFFYPLASDTDHDWLPLTFHCFPWSKQPPPYARFSFQSAHCNFTHVFTAHCLGGKIRIIGVTLYKVMKLCCDCLSAPQLPFWFFPPSTRVCVSNNIRIFIPY